MSNYHPPERPSSYPVPELSPTIQVKPRPRDRWLSYGLNAAAGLGVLLVGVPAAWLLGIGAASLMARPSQKMPLQEVILRRTNRVVTEIQRLPSRWRPAPPLETRIEPVPIPTQPLAPLTQPPATLNQREQQIAKEELAALEQEFETIRKRLLDLESKLGQAQSTADIESRLAMIEQRLSPDSPSAEPDLDKPPSGNSADEPSPRPALLETTELKITLPSDALFAPGEARLLNTAPPLLNSIFEDLAPYANATILIGSHSDDRLEPSASVSLTFQQANALRAYLAGNLPEQRWITVGYGQNQPATDNSTPELQQRNRRIEIAIDRR